MRAVVKGTHVRGGQDAIGSQPLLALGFPKQAAGQIQAEGEQEQVKGKSGNFMVVQDFFFSKWFCSLELF